MRFWNLTREGETAYLTGFIFDKDGNRLGADELDTLTLTLTDANSHTVINGREDQDVLNVNGGTIDNDGNFELRLDIDDTIIVNDYLPLEWHEAELTWTYQTNSSPPLTDTNNDVLKYRIVNRVVASAITTTGARGRGVWAGWCGC